MNRNRSQKSLMFSGIGLLLCVLVIGIAGLFWVNAEKKGGKDFSVTLCFGNEAYIKGGDEAAAPLVSISGTLKTTEKKKYFDLIDQGLRTVPAALSGAETAVDEQIVLLDARMEKGGSGIVAVDLKRESLRGSSLTEGLFISQIVESLRRSFPEVKGVRFLTDGKETESLMGHFDASAPFEQGVYDENGGGEKEKAPVPGSGNTPGKDEAGQ